MLVLADCFPSMEKHFLSYSITGQQRQVFFFLITLDILEILCNSLIRTAKVLVQHMWVHKTPHHVPVPVSLTSILMIQSKPTSEIRPFKCLLTERSYQHALSSVNIKPEQPLGTQPILRTLSSWLLNCCHFKGFSASLSLPNSVGFGIHFLPQLLFLYDPFSMIQTLFQSCLCHDSHVTICNSPALPSSASQLLKSQTQMKP